MCFLPIQLPCVSCVNPAGQTGLGLHLNEPSVFKHTSPSPQLCLPIMHSSMSVAKQRQTNEDRGNYELYINLVEAMWYISTGWHCGSGANCISKASSLQISLKPIKIHWMRMCCLLCCWMCYLIIAANKSTQRWTCSVLLIEAKSSTRIIHHHPKGFLLYIFPIICPSTV